MTQFRTRVPSHELPRGGSGAQGAKGATVRPNTMLDAAEDVRGVSQTRAGNRCTVTGGAVGAFETPILFQYLFDIVPQEGSERALALQVDPARSAMVSFHVSYAWQDGHENVETGGESTRQRPVRDHKMFVCFGAGNTEHTVIVDVGEGCVVNVPGQNAYAGLLDYSFERVPPGQPPPYVALVSGGSAQSGTHPVTSYVSTRVFAPYQVFVDTLNPPTIPDLLAQLCDAAKLGTYLL